LLESGHYRAHLARIRATYRARALLVTDALARHCGGRVNVGPVLGGLQLLATWPGPPEDRTVAAHLATAGFATQVLSAMCHGLHRNGLVVGFAKATVEQAEQFARRLRSQLD
jgi:GntR family transcriptional regulator/MocR family aminotransferase